MRFLITDSKRGFTERTFFIAMGLGCLCVLISLGVVLHQGGQGGGIDVFKGAQSLILPFIAPLLAALPYTNMNMIEEDCGYKRLLMSKNHMQTYHFVRWLVSSCVSGVALAVPVGLLGGLCYLVMPFNDVQLIGGVVILNFLFGFSYGSICYGLTFVNRKRYIPTVAPQVLYLLFIYAFPYLSLEKYYPPLSFSPWLLPRVDSTSILMQFVFLNSMALILIVGRICYDHFQYLGHIE